MIQAIDNPRAPEGGDGLAAGLEERSGQPIRACYQCQRCSSFCPMAGEMDLRPHQLVRLIQLGLAERVYASKSYWLCVGCSGCGASCPNGIDIHRVADVMQQTAGPDARKNAAALRAFDRAFLATVRRGGRAHEIGLVMRFKLATGKLVDDMGLGLWMFLRGKLKPLARRIRGRREVRAMFRKGRRP
jgi:heterodisulfide reductase subunit C